ncbi:recombinase family protein [Luteolibacter sp. GHJ8]|uniref:Recombinase family protein n=1 Tax=Luteolibacter rhizosphaerae TaxID=2989719 RepID=A0ABT3FZR0_9BACT|nr:recombinase family protein [Luteolibacter rhizosphaerae]MCW1913071.1 recombinase family protein [Luteolibacter rhizosphaerae]
MYIGGTCAPCFPGSLTQPAANQPAPQPGRPRACSFVRVSTQEQAEDGRAGLLRQREEVARVIRSKGYELVHQIELIDVSGTATLHAPEVQDLLVRIERKELDVVVTAEMSRLLRPDDLSSFSLLQTCKQNGVLIDVGGSAQDLNSPEGFVLSGILALMSGSERMTMRRRLEASREAKRAAGLCPSPRITLPTGVEFLRGNENRWIYTTDVAPVVEAFRIVDEEGVRNLSEVARRTGLHPRNVRHLLANTIYKGIRSITKMRSNEKSVRPDGRQKDKRKIPRPSDRCLYVRVFSPEDQAVSDARFDRVQRVLASIKEAHEIFVEERHRGSMLSGVGRCACCSDRLYAKTRSYKLADGRKHSGHYLCATHHESRQKDPANRKCGNGWVTKTALDSLASAFIERFLGDQEFVTAVLSFARSKQSNIVGFAVEEATKAKLDDLSRRDARILSAIEAGAMEIHEGKQARLRIQEQRKALLASMDHAAPLEDDVELRGIAGRLALGPDEWKRLQTPKEQKAFIAGLFTEIYFRRDEITAFRLAPSLVGPANGAWAFAANMPVILETPFRITEPEPGVPEGMKACTRCRQIRPLDQYYRHKAICRSCNSELYKERYRRKRDRERGQEA